MREADKEIIEILKKLFRKKDNELINPDDLLREKIVKWSIYVALFCVITLVPAKILGHTGVDYFDGLLSFVIGGAFTLLFVYLNIKSKNPSLILYVLAWLSLMVSLWLAS